MKKMRLVTMMAQGTAFIVLCGGFYWYNQHTVQPSNVYVFSRDISKNTIIQDGDLKAKTIPADAITDNMITDKTKVIGKTSVTDTYAGEYAINNQFVNSDDVDVFSQMDLSNYRKISFEVNAKNAIAGNIKKGDSVDLIFSEKTESASTGSGTYAKTFLQDVLVYSVVDTDGKQYVDQTESSTDKVDENGNTVKSGSLSVITLAVKPDQAEQIQARLLTGTVSVVGRFEDSVNSSTQGFTLGDLKPITSTNSNPEQ